MGLYLKLEEMRKDYPKDMTGLIHLAADHAAEELIKKLGEWSFPTAQLYAREWLQEQKEGRNVAS